jgi:CRP-like cAMP-binding protein
MIPAPRNGNGTVPWPNGITRPNLSFLAALTSAERDDLFALGRSRVYRDGQPLLRQGDRGNDVVLLRYGRAKVAAASVDGRDVLLGLRGAGDILGEMSYLSGAPRTATVTAVEAVTAVVVEFGPLRAFLQNNPRVLHEIARSIGDRLRWADRRRCEFGLPVAARLARLLYDLACGGSPVSPVEWSQPRDVAAVEVPVTQRELGQLVGAAEVSVQKALRQLAKEGWLATRYGRITINRPAEFGRYVQTTIDRSPAD